MESDTVYRDDLERTIASLEAWARDYSDVSEVHYFSEGFNWRMTSQPYVSGACALDLLLRKDRRFDLKIGSEFYDDKPIDRLDFFVMLVRAVASGHVERVDVVNALTASIDAVETRVTLEDGWAWIGERRTGLRGSRRMDSAQELRTHRFLAYRR